MMSEERNESGQFQSPAYGEASVERDAGFKPMQEAVPAEKAGDFASTQEAAEAVAERREEAVDETVRTYADEKNGHFGFGFGEEGFGRGEKVDLDTIDFDRAVHDLTKMRGAETKEADDKAKEELAKEVDELRGETKDDEPADKEAKPDEPIPDDQVDAEIERALKHPKIKEAVEQRVTAADTARQQFSDTAQSTVQLAEIMFLTQFPEISALDPSQREQAAEAMRVNDPARYQKLVAVLNHAQAAQQQQQQARQFEEIEKVQKFNAYAAAEDTRFDAMIKDTPERKAEVTKAIQEIATESGLSSDQFMQMFRTEPIMRNAAFQKMMYDAGQYRIMQANMEKARALPVNKHLPPVHRPGTARGNAEIVSDKLAALERRLNQSGSIKDAAALVTAKRSMSQR